jgi:hypothetical protein
VQVLLIPRLLYQQFGGSQWRFILEIALRIIMKLLPPCELLLIESFKHSSINHAKLRTSLSNNEEAAREMPIDPRHYFNRPDGHEDRLRPMKPIYRHFHDDRPKNIRDWIRDPNTQSYSADPYRNQNQYVPRYLMEQRV